MKGGISMSKINELTTLAYIKASMAADRTIASLRDAKDDERGSSELVVTLILIGIAAAALIIFKDKIFNDWIPAILEKLDDIFNFNSNSTEGGGFRFFVNRF